MSSPRNRRRQIRKLAQAARERSKKPLPPISVDPVDPVVEEDALASAPTSVGDRAEPPADAHASTVALPSIRPTRPSDPGEETAPAEDGPSASSVAPDPPERLRFLCPCGAPMTATHETYDRRTKCNGCEEVLLVALLLDPKTKAWRIEPLRTGI
jgi:hypothetical protein